MANTIDKIRLSATTYDLVDSTAVHSLDGYPTVEEMNTAITASSAAVLETVQEAGYQTSGDVQNAISGKADTTAVTQSINEAVSGKVDTTTYTAYTSATDTTLAGKADISDIPSVSGYADSVKYNTTSKYVEFYHGGTGGTKVFEYDASPFLIDGMVQNVEIKDVTISGESVTCLVISFNTDAGKQDINIPLTEIFDASNYYTTAQTDSKIAESISGKADSSAVTEEISAAVSGKADSSDVQSLSGTVTAHAADTTIHVTSSDKTTWNGKQDALESGVNIKTINNTSILGSGNITIQSGNNVEVSGTTLVFN